MLYMSSFIIDDESESWRTEASTWPLTLDKASEVMMLTRQLEKEISCQSQSFPIRNPLGG